MISGTRIIPLLFLLISCLLFLLAPASAGSHPFTVHDLVMLNRVSDPAVSPDSQWIAFTLRSTDIENNTAHTSLWIVPADGSLEPRQLTSPPGSDSNPCWSPDGRRIYYLSTRSNSSQVWRIAPGGGIPVQVTFESLDAGNLKVSPDGRKIAYSMEVFPNTTPTETKRLLEAEETRNSSGMIYDRLFIRHWDTWSDGRRSHLFVRPLDEGPAIDIMQGMDADSPTKPFGGREEYTFTPDSSGIIFAAVDPESPAALTPDRNLYLAPSDGSHVPECLTGENPASETQPSFSPDGTMLAYLATSRPGYESDQYEIRFRPWPAGNETVCTGSWDRSPATTAWAADGRSIYALAADLGQTSLSAIDISTGNVRVVVPEGTVSFAAPAKDRIIFTREDLQSPADLWSVQADGTDLQQITAMNRQLLSTVRMGDYEQFSFSGWNNETVYGYVIRPVDFDPGKKYPVAMLIHGGPQDSMANEFHYRWNPQPYAGRGYAVIEIDYHGSTGYGQGFTDSISGDWGGKSLEDLMHGLNASLERYPWMDGYRVSALGGSFGGYMVNWIEGNWPDRFRCLVSHAGELDLRTAYYATDELWFPEWEQGGTPWDNPEGYSRHNPALYVQNWKTPMLVIHGSRDYRVAETQGFSTFTALQRRGIPSKLLYFPDESHWVLKPANSILWYDTVLDWLDQWTEPG